jgi:hypothetical protein
MELHKHLTHLFKHNVDAKLLCWTNQRVSNWNNAIVKSVFGELGLFKNQLLTGTRTVKKGGNNGDTIIENSKEYRILSIAPGLKRLNGIKIEGKYLKVRNGDDITDIFVVASKSKPQIADLIYNELHRARTVGGGKGWRRYYNFRGNFVLGYDINSNHGTPIDKKDFTFGYCSTVHKSQGSTYSVVGVDYRDVSRNSNNLEMKRLLYVALSRASNVAYILI